MKREKIKMFSDMFHCSDPHSEMCETLKTKKQQNIHLIT